MPTKREFLPVLQAIFAAVLFGASAPLSKVLLGELDPIPLAGFLYLGSGLGAVIMLLVQSKRVQGHQVEARLSRQDIPWLSGAIIAGGIIAPIFLLIGLRITPASTASLLLNFETVATALIAILIFKEAIDKRIFWAIALITLASILLSWSSEGWGFSPAALLILAACFFWGLDNNFTRNISSKDPLVIVSIKGLIAGSFSLILALILGNSIPKLIVILLALLLGAICYGLSIYLIILSMRHLGSTRAYALFATAPFAGTLLSFILLHDKPLWNFWPGMVIMIAGTWVMISEHHAHDHTHEPLFHTHNHRHPDDHHDHVHQPGEILIRGEHSHEHQHTSLDHVHKHTPDLHHRHTHN
jgi:drug/metabolite transporter (DMT)-like permease